MEYLCFQLATTNLASRGSRTLHFPDSICSDMLEGGVMRYTAQLYYSVQFLIYVGVCYIGSFGMLLRYAWYFIDLLIHPARI